MQVRLSLVLVACASALAGCGSAQAGTTPPLQGVVHYEERVLSFELGGRIVEIPVQRGQDVSAGLVVARLDDALQRAARDMRAADLVAAGAELELLEAGARAEDVRAAESEVSALKAQTATLRKDLVRQRALRAGAAVAQRDVDETEGRLEATLDRRRALSARLMALRSGARDEELAAATARVQSAEAALAAEDVRLARHELRAFIAGNVVDIHLDPGEMAAPGTPIVTLADPERPYVDVFVPEAQATSFRPRQSVKASVDGVDKPFEGQIEHIFPKMEFTPRFLFSEGERPKLVLRMRVRIKDPARRLHSGLPAFVTP